MATNLICLVARLVVQGIGKWCDTCSDPGTTVSLRFDYFNAVVIDLQVGQMSAVIKTQFGYHLILCEGEQAMSSEAHHSPAANYFSLCLVEYL